MKSKFSFWTILILFPFIVLTGLNLFLIDFIFTEEYIESISIFLLLIGFLTFTWTWIFYGEFRTKVISVIIEEDSIISRNYFGLGRKLQIMYDEMDGYTTCLLPSKNDNYEYLYIIRSDKKIIKLSEFYHKNYSQLKTKISKRIQFLGKERFSYRREFKEIFI